MLTTGFVADLIKLIIEKAFNVYDYEEVVGRIITKYTTLTPYFFTII